MIWVDVVINLFAAFGGVCAAMCGYGVWDESRDKRNRKPTEAQLLQAAGRVIRQASEARRKVDQLQRDEWHYAYALALGLPRLEVHGPTLDGAPSADYRRRLRLGASTEPVGQVVGRGVLTTEQAAAIRQAVWNRDTELMPSGTVLQYADGNHVMSRCGCMLCQQYRFAVQRFSGGGVV